MSVDTGECSKVAEKMTTADESAAKPWWGAFKDFAADGADDFQPLTLVPKAMAKAQRILPSGARYLVIETAGNQGQVMKYHVSGRH